MLLSTSGLGGEIDLGGKFTAVGGLLAATGIWQMLGYVAGSIRGLDSRLTRRTSAAGTG